MSDLPAPLPGHRVHLVSLGCPKNRVDSEIMLGHLTKGGYMVVDNAEDADVLLVNTCAFIDEAKAESVDAILELAEIKERSAQRGHAPRLVVAGCLAQRHAELRVEMPEVDAFVGTGEYHRVLEALLPSAVPHDHDLLGKPWYVADHVTPRVVSTEPWTAYVKIAEGCSQPCAFCIIPKLRGKQRSRQVDDVVAECRDLATRGVIEINLVAQDLTHYGEDIGDPGALQHLVQKLGELHELKWVRLLYAYPHNFTDGLIDAMATSPNCLRYLDMPLQHGHDAVLAAMKRMTSRDEIVSTLDRIRARMPDLVLRTTLLVGHPGETEAHFQDLLAFVEAQRFDRLGVFAYSQEEGTLSARLPDQVPSIVRKARRAAVMKLQEGIAKHKAREMVGRVVEVLIEGASQETDLLLQGRTQGQAPDIDGVTYINDVADGVPEVRAGQLRRVKLSRAAAHDFVGKVVA